MKAISISKAKKKAWKEFSIYIRLRNADKYGLATCITCKTTLPWQDMQAGHFLPGRKNAVLYCEVGVHSQCFNCNITLKSNWPEYLEYMKQEYGISVVNQLMARRRETVQMKASDHIAVYEKYKQKVADLKKQRGIL